MSSDYASMRHTRVYLQQRKMVAMYNGCRVIVYIFVDNFPKSLSLGEKYLFILKVAEDFKLDGYTIEDFYDWAAEPLLPIFCQLGTLPDLSKSLKGLLFLESHSLTLRANGESLIAIPYYDKVEEFDDPIVNLYRDPEADTIARWILTKKIEDTFTLLYYAGIV
ncbi:uncharacterized protein TrAFT101_011782 [Trichoderma asperellum]|uniref:uncharacterized protein n=1 Tax=Trichoderma asperellum TaxID=101201 RepID=UPI003329FBD9|nr:hypothetical protein TrAFT101_011782 [Trichoderma asperellum]